MALTRSRDECSWFEIAVSMKSIPNLIACCSHVPGTVRGVSAAGSGLQFFYCNPNTTVNLAQASLTFRIDNASQPVEDTCFCLLVSDDVSATVQVEWLTGAAVESELVLSEDDVTREPEEVRALKLFYARRTRHEMVVKTREGDVAKEIGGEKILRLTPGTQYHALKYRYIVKIGLTFAINLRMV